MQLDRPRPLVNTKDPPPPIVPYSKDLNSPWDLYHHQRAEGVGRRLSGQASGGVEGGGRLVAKGVTCPGFTHELKR